MRDQRRMLVWEEDGLESSVALISTVGISFVVNGKVDGAAIGDSQTQVMAGVLGPFLLPQAKRAIVVGMGTGSSAGWLAKGPAIERVDVVELEPAILHVARVCAPVNAGVMDNPKIHTAINDARGGAPDDARQPTTSSCPSRRTPTARASPASTPRSFTAPPPRA